MMALEAATRDFVKKVHTNYALLAAAPAQCTFLPHLSWEGGQKRIKLNWLLLERRKKGLLGQNAIFCWISAERARALERLQKKMVTIEKKTKRRSNIWFVHDIIKNKAGTEQALCEASWLPCLFSCTFPTSLPFSCLPNSCYELIAE